MTRAKDISKIITDADFSGTLDVTGTVTAGDITVNDTIRLDNENTTISTGDVFGDIEFYDNDGGSASAGVTAKVEAKAVNTYGSSDLNFYTSNSSGGARTAQKVAMTVGGGNDISFYEDTGTTPKFFWDSSAERLGIGTSSPDNLLHISGASGTTTMKFTRSNTADTGNDFGRLKFENSAGTTLASIAAFSESGNTQAGLKFNTGTDSQAVLIDQNGNVGIGTSSPGTALSFDAGTNTILGLNFNASSGNGGSLQIRAGGGNGSGNSGGNLNLCSGTGTNSASVGNIIFGRSSGDNTTIAPDEEWMRITSGGQFLVGTTVNSPSDTAGIVLNGNINKIHATRSGGSVAYFNRLTNDGTIIEIAQNGTVEGQISVSGTAVSYGGGHLSRWSRLLDNNKDTSIVKGTVMTNLDEMVEWSNEDNEQLNKMAVSSVEGDANVAGVFVNWDSSDDWNDMIIAMTGDMVIRIAQGTTVARGDLLMSAGDGTAKPQDDDIVRSKTIAKVTSTNVSHTYDDGTYLVPCVLMAC